MGSQVSMVWTVFPVVLVPLGPRVLLVHPPLLALQEALEELSSQAPLASQVILAHLAFPVKALQVPKGLLVLQDPQLFHTPEMIWKNLESVKEHLAPRVHPVRQEGRLNHRDSLNLAWVQPGLAPLVPPVPRVVTVCPGSQAVRGHQVEL